ncbi:PREDICTED: 52 kDa repressor of the inhibitor of the protein kinase-like, partial [Rhagoletis zephyria]|uniref:52 kDa repressor of the inhibitor of the protein kinase-like n=1 Tax=Rhagoletis zephyria TaxID=28612 RepID=UPI00081120BB
EDAILPSVIDDGQSEKCNQDSDQDIVATLWQANQFDIGKANRDSLDDVTKKYILTSLLLPKLPHRFPVTAGKSGNRSFQPTWITEDGFDFLAYSTSEDGVYCKKCWLFYHEGVGKGYHQNPGKLVTTSCRDWKKAIELFKKHKNMEYHEVCDTRATSFLNVASGKQLDILSQLDIQRANEKEENRAALRPIIETVLFCGEQELPLRGDNDSGAFSLERPEKKDGKFRALLRFRINSGDKELKKHITNSAKNATYLSPQMQNEIIQTASDIVTEKIINKVYNTDCFSILGDETMDVSGTEQLSICLRYVDFTKDSSTPVLREDFVGFVPIDDQCSVNLSNVILQRCEELKLDMNKCVGQGYDGAANMAGRLSGVQKRIKNQYHNARYYHCASHRLNLAVANAMSMPVIRNCHGVVGQIINLFRNTSNANKIFQKSVQKYAPDSKKKRLLRLCETRFIERHESIISFMELFECIAISLEEIAGKTWSVSSTASALIAAIQKSDFIVGLLVCEKLLSLTLPLSVFLQEKSLDFISAINRTKEIIQSLRDIRESADDFFGQIFSSASNLAKDFFDSEIRAPRFVSRQTNRANPQTASSEAYFRITVFLPCIDSLVENFTERFLENEDVLPTFQLLLPGFADVSKADELDNLASYFEDQMSSTAVKAEYRLWSAKVSSIDKSSEVLKLLEYCEGNYFR